ncbi:hypothetical protein [Actinomadura hibisca]|uniref:hypothetical protein n=1 Tax=Actinomadura hibisca TaxID=68565 RepID=UPI00082975A0|nr:hypothetical protein [Actinomadura hibisca]
MTDPTDCPAVRESLVIAALAELTGPEQERVLRELDEEIDRWVTADNDPQYWAQPFGVRALELRADPRVPEGVWRVWRAMAASLELWWETRQFEAGLDG